MPANRDKKTGKWNCQFYYTDWTGKKVKKMKRGFETKKEAQDWERHFKLEKASSLDMTFGDFYRRYEEDVKPKVRENTWNSKVWVIEKKILPYFKDLVMRDITPRDVLAWQNEIWMKPEQNTMPVKLIISSSSLLMIMVLRFNLVLPDIHIPKLRLRHL